MLLVLIVDIEMVKMMKQSIFMYDASAYWMNILIIFHREVPPKIIQLWGILSAEDSHEIIKIIFRMLHSKLAMEPVYLVTCDSNKKRLH